MSSSSSSSSSISNSASIDLGLWNGDDILAARISNLKAGAATVNAAVTRLAMVYTTVFTPDAVNEVIAEILADVESLGRFYLELIHSPCGWSLFDCVCEQVKLFLQQVRNLFQLVKSKDCTASGVRNQTGMVWECNDSVQVIPTSNEAMYREIMKRNISAVKDTCLEFTGYLDEARELTAGGKVVDPSLYEEDEEGNMQYMPHEVIIVAKCVELLNFCKFGLECAFVAISLIGSDTSELLTDAGNRDAGNGNDNGRAYATMTMTSQIMRWISTTVPMFKAIEGALIDTAAELYPRIDENSVRSHWTDLQLLLKAFLDLFNQDFIVQAIAKRPQLVKKFASMNENPILSTTFENAIVDPQ